MKLCDLNTIRNDEKIINKVLRIPSHNQMLKSTILSFKLSIKMAYEMLRRRTIKKKIRSFFDDRNFSRDFPQT